ncbi:hypothetical protein [Luteimonas sp. MC1750]|uniref:hypothetical protein n=1 Tax=Luteimonas sp. MC1750 TaxID=2799326 RepID=UPI0018F0C627|nr:hypothetical protein [Luteimonas sp. MC1750]MBJ6984230.1 hypothetical protein [Luteimonas sp. MC1750]QQO06983.1 hypothetical protein JGR68_06090 [Luteimonas sp. MC1750]
MSPARWIAFVALIAVLVAAGYGLVTTRGELQRLHEDLAAANAALQQGDKPRAAAIARDVLARAPVMGRAFGIIARAEDGQGGADATRARYGTAARRAPRDPQVRGWLATHALESGDFAAAADHLDALLTVAPAQRQQLLELIAQLAQDPAFAEALATHLVQRPQWRAAILRATTASRVPEAADNLHGALRAQGALDADDTARWIDGMLRDGRWGSAYARWVSGLETPPERLPVPWNGDFSRAPSSSGFDWRVRRVPGVLFDRIALDGGRHAARLRFLGRPVGDTGLEVPMLLAPGDHVLHLRARTQGLRSDQGLEWRLTCSDGRTAIGAGARVREARDWADLAFTFTVPAREGCEGQWLRLVNPAPRGVAQILRGELHLADLRVGP